MSGVAKSPWKESGVNIRKNLGFDTPTPKKAKKEAESIWRSADEYAEFCREHQVFGNDANKLKKQIDKYMTPKITERRGK